MEDCIFCKIVNKEIPSYTIYEDDDVMAFLDISQVTKGHTLVIPKKHFKDVFEIDSKTMSNIFEKVNMIAKHICKTLNVSDVNILNNNGIKAGQTVFHYHVHIIPRYDEKDKITIKFNENNDVDIKKVFDLIKL